MKKNFEIAFPIISKETKPFYPSENICPICNTDRRLSSSEFYVLNVGALEKVSKNTSMMSDKLEGFCHISYHPGEDSEENGFKVDIVEAAKCGQFDIYFCSINCMRTFFNTIVDTVEKKQNEGKIK